MKINALNHFQLEFPQPNLCCVWIDVQHRSMNLFTREVMDELAIVLEHLRTTSPDFVVFVSRKSTGFFAGADVHAIRRLTDDQVQSVLKQGQDLFARLEQLASCTIAAIHGPCLGGGLEFALACDYRLVRNDRQTQLGLPEIQLGLIPGWGGTQRLPKLIGLSHALPLILQGRKVSARRALKIGLADQLVQADQWPDEIFRQVIALPNAAPQRLRNVIARLSGFWPICRIIERKACQSIRSRQAHYPALPAAVKAVTAAVDTRTDGFATERLQFAKLLKSDTCRRLLDLFVWREQARSVSMASPAPQNSADRSPSANDEVCVKAHATNRQQIGVIGAGAMGAGIAQLLAVKGFPVIVRELTPELADAGRVRIQRQLNKLVERGKLTQVERDHTSNRMSFVTDLQQLADCTIVIEAVVEEAQIKATLFKELDHILAPEAVIVSNTSALSVTDLADVTRRPDRVAGLHFFNPVHRMELVEIVRTADTSDLTIDILLQLAKRIGKTPVITADHPGFLVNRVLFPYLSEAIHLVREGVDPRDIDREAQQFGLPMGPLQLLDHVGLDVALHVTERLRAVLPQSEPAKRMLQQLVERGCCGRKTSRGFYQYQGTQPLGISPPLNSILSLNRDNPDAQTPEEAAVRVGRFVDDGLSATQRRLVYAMVNEAGFCLQDRVVQHAWQADLALVLGTGFAPFRGGPLSFATSLRPSTVLNNFAVLAARHGERFKCSAWLMDHIRHGPKPLDVADHPPNHAAV